MRGVRRRDRTSGGAGFRLTRRRGVDSAWGTGGRISQRRRKRGQNVLDRRKSRTLAAIVARRKERQPDRRGTRRWRDAQCGDRQSTPSGSVRQGEGQRPGAPARQAKAAASPTRFGAEKLGRRRFPRQYGFGVGARYRSRSRAGTPRGRGHPDVAQGDDRRTERGHVQMAAWRSDDAGVPLLRHSDPDRGAVLRSSRAHGLSAGPGSAARTGARAPRRSPDDVGSDELSHLAERLVEGIAGAAHGADRVALFAARQRLAQPPDMDVDGALVDLGRETPDAIEQLGARKNPARLFQQIFKQPEFGRTEM